MREKGDWCIEKIKATRCHKHKKAAPIRTIKVKRPLKRQRKMLDARIKIMWEEQLADPPIDYETSVNVP